MQTGFRIDGLGWLGALRRAGGDARALSAVNSASGVRSVLGPDQSAYPSRLVNAKAPIDAAGPSQADAAGRAIAGFTGFANRLHSEHTISVRSLATSAEARSQGFDPDQTVRAGTLTLSVHGADYNITLAGGSLSNVVDAIRASGAPVEIGTGTDGVKEYLTLKARDPGYKIGGVPDDALTLSESYTGSDGQALEANVVKQASNAEVNVDGLSYVRRSNTISDILPEATLRLDALGQSTTNGNAFLTDPFRAGLAASAPSGVYSVSVQKIATAAAGESKSFASSFSGVKAGTLDLQVAGTSYKVDIVEGATLGDIANRIQNAGAPVDVQIKTDGSGGYKLALSSRATGYATGGKPGDALRVTEESTGSTGQALSIETTQAASNAELSINGRKVESPSNIVTGATPGLTLQLRTPTESAESVVGDLTIARNAQDNLIDASNDVFRVLQDRLLAAQPSSSPVVAPEDTSDRITEASATRDTGEQNDGQQTGLDSGGSALADSRKASGGATAAQAAPKPTATAATPVSTERAVNPYASFGPEAPTGAGGSKTLGAAGIAAEAAGRVTAQASSGIADQKDQDGAIDDGRPEFPLQHKSPFVQATPTGVLGARGYQAYRDTAAAA